MGLGRSVCCRLLRPNITSRPSLKPWTQGLLIRCSSQVPSPVAIDDEVKSKTLVSGVVGNATGTALHQSDPEPPTAATRPEKHQHFSNSEDELIMKRLSAGAAYATIASELERPYISVYSRLRILFRRYGVVQSMKNRSSLKSAAQDVLVMLERHPARSITEIADQMHLEEHAVKSNLTRSVRKDQPEISRRPQTTEIQPRRRFFTKEEDEYILNRKSQGETYKSIAVALERPTGAVWKRAFTLGSGRKPDGLVLSRKRSSTLFTDADDFLIIHRKEEGASNEEVALELGGQFKHQQIGHRYWLLRRYGMGSGPIVTQAHHWSLADFQRIEAMRINGISWRKIAALEQGDADMIAHKYFSARERIKGPAARRSWSPDAINRLMRLRDEQNLSWAAIAKQLHCGAGAARHAYFLERRRRGITKARAKAWSAQEVDQLRELVKRYGSNRSGWAAILSRMTHRTLGSLKFRYYNYIYKMPGHEHEVTTLG